MRRVIAVVSLILVLGGAAEAHKASTRLPLGDGKVSSEPRRGYVMACRTGRGPGGGAFRDGEWIGGGTWDPDAKPIVEGNVEWPNASISITVEGDRRVIRANSLPQSPTGEFPVKPGTEAYNYDRNPNSIGEQPILLSLPLDPQPAAQPTCTPMGMIGFTTSGVAIYNALDELQRDAPAHEIQDACNGHPQRSSQYHYHDWSPCLAGGDPDAPVGWMLDGYPILGPIDADGRTLTDADLDECHGRTGPVLIDGKRVTMYHYRFTMEYPYTIGCFRGAVDPSLMRPPGRGGPPRF